VLGRRNKKNMASFITKTEKGYRKVKGKGSQNSSMNQSTNIETGPTKKTLKEILHPMKGDQLSHFQLQMHQKKIKKI